MNKAENAARQEAFYTLLPAKGGERIYNTTDLLAIQICFGIAAWFFLIGSQTGMWLTAAVAIPTIVFGNAFGQVLMIPISLVPSRYGVEQMLGTVPIFGRRFTPFNLLMFYMTCWFAMALATLMFGKAASQLSIVIFGPDNFLSTHELFWSFICLIGGFLIALSGPEGMKNFIRVAALGMLATLIGLIFYIFTHYGWDVISNALPSDPLVMVEGDDVMNKRWNIAVALEMNIGMGVSWTYWYGQYSRLAKTESAGYHGCQWGWGALAAIAGVFAALAALAIQQYDPTTWLIDVADKTGNMTLPILGLVLFAAANVSSVATLVYPGALTTVTHFPKLNWNAALAIAAIPGFIVMAIPGFYDSIAQIYAITAALCILYGTIVVIDYHFLSKGIIDLRQLYNKREGYFYWHGINPAAAIAWIAGAVFYLWTYNPFSLTSANGWFPYITATLPTAVLTGVIYYGLMKIWVMKNWPQPFQYMKERAKSA